MRNSPAFPVLPDSGNRKLPKDADGWVQTFNRIPRVPFLEHYSCFIEWKKTVTHIDDSASPRPFPSTAESPQTQKLCFDHQFSLVFHSSLKLAGNCHQYVSHVGICSLPCGCCFFEQYLRWWARFPCDLISTSTEIWLVEAWSVSLLSHCWESELKPGFVGSLL